MSNEPPIARLSTPTARLWAASSLTAGLIWLLLAIMPIPFTTLLGLPFAGWAIAVGWWSRQASKRQGDAPGRRQAGWGVGLGCAGLTYVVVINTILASLLITGAWVSLNILFNGTPTPAP
jgi:hypothetical protein